MEEVLFMLLVVGYIGVTYYLMRVVNKNTTGFNVWMRLCIQSFGYALFWGIGIAGSGGDPGFALPAPNIVALGLMTSIGFYSGLVTGGFILMFWWAFIALGMAAKVLWLRRKSK